MDEFSLAELEAAQKAIRSTIHKSEAVIRTLSAKQPPRTAQVAMVAQRLKAFHAASATIDSALGTAPTSDCSKEDLADALRIIPPLIDQIEEAQVKFMEGTAQHTLAVRRVRAFHIALTLMERALG